MSLFLALISFLLVEFGCYLVLLPRAGATPSIWLLLAGVLAGITASVIVHQIVWSVFGLSEKRLNNPAPFYSDMPSHRALNAVYAVLKNTEVNGDRFHYLDCIEERGELGARTNLAHAAFRYPLIGGALRTLSEAIDRKLSLDENYFEVRFEVKVKVTPVDRSSSRIQVYFINRARPAIFNPWGATQRTRFLREIKDSVRARPPLAGQREKELPSLRPMEEIAESFDSMQLYFPDQGASSERGAQRKLISQIGDENDDSLYDQSFFQNRNNEPDCDRKVDGDRKSAVGLGELQPRSGSGPGKKISLPAGQSPESYRWLMTSCNSLGSLAAYRVALSAQCHSTPSIDWSRAQRELRKRVSPQSIDRICQGAALQEQEALVELGELICEGLNGPPDYKKALKLFEVASRSGYPPAFLAMAQMHSHGLGTAVDQQKALRLVEIATAGGYAPALYELGMRYCTGDSVPLDTYEGSQYLLAAASNGFAPAQLEMGLLLLTRSPCRSDHRDPVYWFGEAGRNGISQAYYYLGLYYLGANDLLMQPDYPAAANALKSAVDLGDAKACYELGLLYMEGLGVERNILRANELLEAAAKAGVTESITVP